MAYIIIQSALQSNRWNRGPQRPPTRGENIVIACLVGAILIGGVIFGVWAWNDQQKFDAQQKQVHQAWDAGMGRPEAAKVDAGKTVTVPTTVSNVSEYWDGCTYKTCASTGVQHYPMVYPIGRRSLYHGCYTVSPSNQVDQIMVASTPGGATYTVTLAADRKTIKICATTKQHDDDQLVIWSDSPSAKRA